MYLSTGGKTKKAHLESVCKLQSLVVAYFLFPVSNNENYKYKKLEKIRLICWYVHGNWVHFCDVTWRFYSVSENVSTPWPWRLDKRCWVGSLWSVWKIIKWNGGLMALLVFYPSSRWPWCTRAPKLLWLCCLFSWDGGSNIKNQDETLYPSKSIFLACFRFVYLTGT